MKKKNWVTITLAVLLVAAVGVSVALAMNGGKLLPEPTPTKAAAPTPSPTAEATATPTQSKTSTTTKKYDDILAYIDTTQAKWFKNPVGDYGAYDKAGKSQWRNDYINLSNSLTKNYTDGVTTTEIVDKANIRSKEMDAFLNKLYNKIKATIPSADFEKLKQSESKWIKDRDNFLANLPKSGGSKDSIDYAEARYDVILFRALLLLQYMK